MIGDSLGEVNICAPGTESAEELQTAGAVRDPPSTYQSHPPDGLRGGLPKAHCQPGEAREILREVAVRA